MDIQSSQAAVSQIHEEGKKIQMEIDAIREKDLDRQKEIELIDLNLKAFRLDEELQKILIKVKIQERAVEKKLKALNEMRQKSFLARLIRR
jgi:hypothetical protein